MFLIASRFSTPPLAFTFFNLGATMKCGHSVGGPYCQGCALLREKLEEDLVTYFRNFQNTSESSDDSTNVVNAPREPFVFKKDHGVNPPHIHECWCECGDALDGISTMHLVTVETLIFRKIFTIFNNSISVVIKKHIEDEQAANARYWKTSACYDDDDDYNSAITPVLSIEEPVDSLSMGDEHFDTILATKSDEVIKSSVKDPVLIPSESE
nr:hypothetical protein [Tanacetum cinerariifolium]